MERSEVDIDEVVKRERVSRRALIRVRQLILEAEGTDPATIPLENLHQRVLNGMGLAASALEWGLEVSKQLKSVAGRDLETPDEWSL